jgi:D-alanine-D-alanine ligase
LDKKLKIAVLMGGRSLEREVSLKSGRRVSGALKQAGHNVIEVDAGEHLVADLKNIKPAVAYIALHGKYGEDGSVQELLDMLKIPYTGPGVLSNIIGFDKVLAKHYLQRENIPTPRFHALSEGAFKDMGASGALPEAVKELGLPLVVKPSAQGSALGVKVVEQESELAHALLGALSYGDKVLLEEYISGTEIAVSVIGNHKKQVLPIVEVIPHKNWFDFESRYTLGMSNYFVPARIDKKLENKIKKMAIQIYELFECKGVSRIDIIIKDDIPYVLELNTSPGMTETSLLPMSAEAAGIDFETLIQKLIDLALGKEL